MSEESTTHFGYKTVPETEKEGMVRGVFDSVASKYDVMNDLMSMGTHRTWKRFTLDIAALRRGDRVLDLACGTGDLSRAMAKKIGRDGQAVMSDINAEMLFRGRDRMLNEGLTQVEAVQANAEVLPFPDEHFDCVTIGFGLRNVTHKEIALTEMNRVLRPGGRLLVLEFSKPPAEALSKIYDQYSFNVLPKLGQLVAGDADSYRYLAESIRMHPDQETLKAMLETAGFMRVQYYNLTGGIVALHRGYKV